MAALLTLLEKDFSGKTTVAQCLRSSRSIPAPEVKRALQDDSLAIDKSQIQISKGTILRSLVELKKAGESTDKSSLDYFSTIATTCHWIQFLCEFHSTSTTTNGEENQSPQDMYEEKPYSNAEIDGIIKQVLASLSGVVAFLSNQAPSDKSSNDKKDSGVVEEKEEEGPDNLCETDVTKSFDPLQIAVFTFSSVLSLNQYAYDRPLLLVSIWKCLEEIASSTKPFPIDVWTKAFKAIASFFSEGVQEILLVTSNAGNVPSHANARLVSQCKVLKFVLSRMEFLCKLPNAVDTLFQQRRLTGLVSELSLLLGLCVLRDGHELEYPQHKNVRENLSQLSKKANGLVTFLLRVSTCKEEDTVLSDALDLALFSCEEEIASMEEAKDGLSTRTIAVISTGKLFLQLQLLHGLLSADGIHLNNKGMERVLQLCEDNMFINMPRIFGSSLDLVGTLACNLVQETLASVIDVFCFIGSSEFSHAAETKSASQSFHFLLISWLNRVSFDDCHPISREVFLTAFCAYTSRLEEHEAFLGLIVGLLFDERTKDSLRQSLSEVVLRMSASRKVKDTLQLFIVDRTETLLTTSSGASRKRKRNQMACLASSILTVLRPVLSSAGPVELSPANPNKSIKLLASKTFAEDDLVGLIRSFQETIADTRSLGKRVETEAMNILHLVQKYCSDSGRGLSIEAISAIVGVLTFCFDECATPTLAAKALEMLANLGESLQASITKVECDKILGMMHKLLRSELWPLRTRCISAFMSFATTVAKADKNTVRDCLPKALQKTFQSRVKKVPFYLKADIAHVLVSYYNTLSSKVKTKKTRRSVFPSQTTLHLSEGSFVVKMPTDGGREAIVVFPPGPDSLRDIEFMLGDESGDRPAVHQLRRIVRTKGGCKLSLCENA
eukprot:scaffold18324_cov176-Amphora_coffeaeformis.AAC.5